MKFKKILIPIIIIVLAIGAYLIWENVSVEPAPPEITGEPTTFSKAGVMTFKKQGAMLDAPYLTYEDGEKMLAFDEFSMCSAESGAEQCIVLNTTLDVPFGGKRVVVEGIETDDGLVLVRKLRKFREGEPEFVPEVGRVFVPWTEAVLLIERCAVSMAMQTHALDVYLTLKDEREVVTVSPVIDEVFSVTQRAQPKCGSIVVAME